LRISSLDLAEFSSISPLSLLSRTTALRAVTMI
jgi:hypothetical protein